MSKLTQVHPHIAILLEDHIAGSRNARVRHILEALGLGSSGVKGVPKIAFSKARDLEREIGKLSQTLHKDPEELAWLACDEDYLGSELDALLKEFGWRIWGSKPTDRSHLLEANPKKYEYYPRDLIYPENSETLKQILRAWTFGKATTWVRNHSRSSSAKVKQHTMSDTIAVSESSLASPHITHSSILGVNAKGHLSTGSDSHKQLSRAILPPYTSSVGVSRYTAPEAHMVNTTQTKSAPLARQSSPPRRKAKQYDVPVARDTDDDDDDDDYIPSARNGPNTTSSGLLRKRNGSMPGGSNERPSKLFKSYSGPSKPASNGGSGEQLQPIPSSILRLPSGSYSPHANNDDLGQAGAVASRTGMTLDALSSSHQRSIGQLQHSNEVMDGPPTLPQNTDPSCDITSSVSNTSGIPAGDMTNSSNDQSPTRSGQLPHQLSPRNDYRDIQAMPSLASYHVRKGPLATDQSEKSQPDSSTTSRSPDAPTTPECPQHPQSPTQPSATWRETAITSADDTSQTACSASNASRTLDVRPNHLVGVAAQSTAGRDTSADTRASMEGMVGLVNMSRLEIVDLIDLLCQVLNLDGEKALLSVERTWELEESLDDHLQRICDICEHSTSDQLTTSLQGRVTTLRLWTDVRRNLRQFERILRRHVLEGPLSEEDLEARLACISRKNQVYFAKQDHRFRETWDKFSSHDTESLRNEQLAETLAALVKSPFGLLKAFFFQDAVAVYNSALSAWA